MNVGSALLAAQHMGAAAPVTVLVADDDPTARVLVSAALDRHVRSIAEAENGLAAMEAIEQRQFDLAILDLDMPVLDGFGVIERVRQRPATRYLPIIVVTGRDDVVAIERAFALGATSFLCKPINWNIFRHQVGYVLQVARIERETRAAKEQAERLAAIRARGLAVVERELASAPASMTAGPGETAQGESAAAAANLRARIMLNRVRRIADILTGSDLDQTSVIAGDLAAAAVARAEATAGPFARGRTRLSGDPGLSVACDVAMATEALAEVLENALLFSPAAEPVQLAIVAAPAGRVRFEIKDRGDGIPEHVLDRALEATGSAPPGSRSRMGLGLPMAKLIAERHGGHFAVMSEAGCGTEVFLSFPSRLGSALGQAA